MDRVAEELVKYEEGVIGVSGRHDDETKAVIWRREESASSFEMMRRGGWNQ